MTDLTPGTCVTAANDVDARVSACDSVPVKFGILLLGLAACGGGPGSATLDVAVTQPWVPRSGTVKLEFTVTREVATGGELTVRAENLPPGITMPDVTVGTGESTGTLAISATSEATPNAQFALMLTLRRDDDVVDRNAITMTISGDPGTLDKTFGIDGLATFPLFNPAYPVQFVAAYPAGSAETGKVVIASMEEIHQLDDEGMLDASFAGGGLPLSSLDQEPEGVTGLQVDSQSRIVIMGRDDPTSLGFATYVTRVLPTGAPDPSFITVDASVEIGTCAQWGGGPFSLTVLPDDSPAVLGLCWTHYIYSPAPPDSGFTPYILRLGPGGGLLTLAGVYPPAGKDTVHGSSLLADSQGRYLMSGSACSGNACEGVVARMTEAGYDAAFGNGGVATVANEESFGSIALDISGDIFAAGNAIARFSGSTGASITSFGAGAELVADGHGHILAITNTNGVTVTGYTPVGTLDASYGNNGVFNDPRGTATAATSTPDGRLIVVGTVGDHAGVWRLWP